MAAPNMGELISAVWDHMMLTTPDPFSDNYDLFSGMFGLPRLSYQQQLDRRRRNYLGDIIPTIALVRHTLRRLQNRRLNPARLQ